LGYSLKKKGIKIMATNSTITIFGHTFEHLSIIRPIGDPVRVYMVQTDEGYYINVPKMNNPLLFKTATSIYADEDFDNIVILHESELPPDAELAGGNNSEVM
jgi:hypothetical protein